MTRYPFILVSLFLLMACHKDSDEIITIIDQPDPPEVLITTRLVTLFKTSSPEMYPEEIVIEGQTMPLNIHPFTQFKGSGLDRDFELMQIRTASGLGFYLTTPLVENDVNYAHFRFPGITAYTGEAHIREEFSIPGEAGITIPAQSLLTADNSVYQGVYVLHAGFLDPENIDAVSMPGYVGRTINNENKVLHFEKCFYISVSTQDGQPLMLTGDASLTTGGVIGEKWIYSASRAIWLVHEDQGSGDPGQMSLGKDLYYAFAQSDKTSRTKGTLMINGQPSPNYPVRFSYPNGTQTIFTTNAGQWAIYLPAGITCTATVELPCGDEQEISFTTANEGESVAQLHIQSTDIINARITGIVRDCNFQPLPLNYTSLEGALNPLVLSDVPELEFHIPVCPQSNLRISSIDPVTGEQGPYIPWPVNDTIQIYSTLACEKANEEYLSLSVSDDQKVYWQLASQSDGDRLIIANDVMDPDLDFQVFIEGMNKGTYTDQMLNIIFEDMALGARGYSLYCPTAASGCGFNQFNLTHFGEEEGQWIRGVFEGRFWIKTFHPLTAGYRNVKGEFQVYREF